MAKWQTFLAKHNGGRAYQASLEHPRNFGRQRVRRIRDEFSTLICLSS
jgi:hypothetical protein